MAADGVFDPERMQHLQVLETDTADVWQVRLPTWPWQYARAEEEREALVDRIAEHAPVRRLWLSDSADDSHGQWLTLAPEQTLAGAGGSGLAYGDWLLLFFPAEPKPESLVPAPGYPKTPAEALQRLQAYGASAAIWSWLDDAEWLVAVAPERAAHA
jgi:hypothetical protein